MRRTHRKRRSLSPLSSPSSLPIALTALALPMSTMAASSSNLPPVDFSRMGTVALGGSFQGLDFWSSSSPFASSSSSDNSSQPSWSTNGDTIFLRSSDGSFHPLGVTNNGGIISAICWADSGSGNGTVYLGGSFSSISGTSASNIASYSLSSNSFSTLGDGVSGAVEAIYCDNPNDQVWVGGGFSDHVAVWSTSSSKWTDVPFKHLNGPVTTITASSNGSSLYFGGNFTTAFASNSSTNATLGNITSIPLANSSVATVGNSGYLTPLTYPFTGYIDPQNQISINANPTTSQYWYADPNVLLCPGEGIWLGQDNAAAEVDVVGFNYLRATGARLVNGLTQGRGTKTFSITAAPSDQTVELTYTDSNGKNQTCTDSCPLSTDSSVTAQDFVFTNGALNITGLNIHLLTWQGGGPGLSSVQLLSDGAFGSAVPNTNKPLCPGFSNSSSVQHSGTWETKVYRADNPTIDTYYVTTTVPINNPTHPSVTFYPFVAAAAFYDVYMVIPGCSKLGDCAGRTSVDIEVQPVSGGLKYTSTISEQVQDDTFTLIYSGPVDQTTNSFSPTVTLTLAQNPEKPQSGDSYVLVADAVDLFLTGISTDGSSTNASRSSGQMVNGTKGIANTTLSTSFGLFEYIRSAQASDATSLLPNTTETALAHLGFALDMAHNMSSDSEEFVINAIAQKDNTVFVGGNFTVGGNYSNVVSIDTGTKKSTSLAEQGLNGVVYSAVLSGSSIYFGGNFSSTATGGTSLNRLAMWDTGKKTWSAVGGGVDGVVTSLAMSDKSLLVLGNFSNVMDSKGVSTPTGGFATWDTDKSQWDTSGILFGNLTSAAIVKNDDVTSAILAGKVSGSSANAVNCVAMLTTGSDGPEISPLTNVNLASSGSAPSSPSKRAVAPALHKRLPNVFMQTLTDSFVTRRDIHRRADAPAIPATTASAPAILSGAFWTNETDNKDTVTIIGGNFSSDGISGVGFYHADGDSPGLTGTSPPVTGLVKALNVMDDSLYIGGVGVNVSGVGDGLVMYDLKSQQWQKGKMSPLSGSGLAINVIRTRIDTKTVVVAGKFANAGSLTCNAVCLWDSAGAQWSTPGQGLQSGEVRALDFAGTNYEVLLVAGSFVLPTGDVSYLASYSFDNSTWTGLGSLPGPALAVAVDDKNATNIFAAGYSSSDNTPYLQAWDGSKWSGQNSSLLPGSIVSQLAFVPISQEHDAVGSIENDRMLMVSGDLVLDHQGNATTALYDGSMMIPYLVGATSAGTLGSASSLFWSQPTFSFAVNHFLATGLVVLVAIAIATGLILLFILLFFLLACIRRRRERNKPPPREMFEKDGRESDDMSSTHQNVFNNVQAALEQSLAGGGAAGAAAAGPVIIGKSNRRSDPSEYGTAEGAYDDEEEEDDEEGRETTMRYDFDGPELQPGEMSMRAGQRVIILDDVQSHEWWYARDPASGREGVVPATYVW